MENWPWWKGLGLTVLVVFWAVLILSEKGGFGRLTIIGFIIYYGDKILAALSQGIDK